MEPGGERFNRAITLSIGIEPLPGKYSELAPPVKYTPTKPIKKISDVTGLTDVTDVFRRVEREVSALTLFIRPFEGRHLKNHAGEKAVTALLKTSETSEMSVITIKYLNILHFF